MLKKVLLTLFLCLAISGLAQATVGPIAYYPFDGNTNDESETITGGAGANKDGVYWDSATTTAASANYVSAVSGQGIRIDNWDNVGAAKLYSGVIMADETYFNH